MEKKSNKRLFVFLGLLLILCLWVTQKYYSLLFDNTNADLSDLHTIDQSAVSASTQSSTSVKEAEGKIDFSKPIFIDGKKYFVLYPYERAEVRSWLHSRGYLNPNDLAVYESYSDQVLKELMKSGDVAALETLKNRAFKNGDQESATRYLNLLAAYGSTPALIQLTIYTSPRYGRDITEEMRRPKALETLAVSKVIELRGDNHLAASARRSFLNGYRENFNIEFQITPEEQNVVNFRAQEILAKLQILRQSKGLGSFDNIEPSSVKKVFGVQ